MKKSIYIIIAAFLSIIMGCKHISEISAPTPSQESKVWEVVSNSFPGNARIYSIKSQDSVVYAGTDVGLYKSDDYGNSWKLIFSTSQSNKSIHSILLKGKTILIGTDRKGIYRSSDEGKTWNPSNSGLIPADSVIGQYIPASDFVSKGDLIFASWWTMSLNYPYPYQCAFSSDDGLNWLPVKNEIQLGNISSLASFDYAIWAGTNNGIYFFDRFGTWEKLNGYSITSLTTGQIGFLFAGTLKKGIRTTDDNWAANGVPPDCNIYCISAYGQYVIAGSDSGKVYISTNNGTTFFTTSIENNVSVISASASNKILFIGTLNGLYKAEIEKIR